MATTKTFLNVSEMDFIALRQAMTTFLSQQDVIKDYDFTGSNISVLLDLLAWNSHLGAHYLNMVGSEMWVDTAQLQDSLFSHAKELNYLPRSKSSARAIVDISIDPGSFNPSTITIPKFYQVTTTTLDSSGNQVQYGFNTDVEVVVTPDALGNFTASNVSIYEGRQVKEVYVVNASSKYVLQSANVDTSSIQVIVQASNNDSTNTVFTLADSLYGVKGTDPVYFLQGAYDGRYEVVFGDGVIGQAVSTGNLVRVDYRDSTGAAPNGAFKFTADLEVEGYAVGNIVTVTRAYGGAEEESNDSIRFYAPRHFTTQERAVVKSDFENLVREQFSQLEAVAVYGGEEIVPKQYGKVVISVKPYGAEIISDKVKSDIISFLTGKNIVTQPVIVDAEYMYVKVDSDVIFDSAVTSSSAEQVRVLALQAALAYTNDQLNDFGINFHTSRLSEAINAADPSIVSNDTRISLIKRWRPLTGSTQSIVFSFGNQLLQETRVADALNHDAIVYSSSFTYRKNGANYQSIIKDDGDGTLVIYTTKNDGTTTVIENDVGSVDYDTGDVTISANVYSYDTRIKIYGKPEKADVSVKANLFLTVDAADAAATIEDING